ncbi:MAG: cysteine desulfurase NifS [Deltaproteobacteria bacterium]|jgi:cysteine desulfurase|nr:cysteine desulfurase NifS [Deltaproteobacteria bacterium]
MNKLIYLDNNATTSVAPEVLEAMLPFLKEQYGNPSSMYAFGGVAHKAIEKARGQVASLLGATPEEIVFTACGTESDSTAILGVFEALPEKRHFITSRVEHSAVVAMGQHLERKGYRVTYLDVDGKGGLDLSQLENALAPDTGIISLMYANNETGVIFPIQEIAELARARGVAFHVDAVQAVGKLPINLATLPVSYLALSGHKLHAPKGVGALYVRRGAPFRPFLRGGHQENGRRAGTENVASIVALGAACDLASRHIHEENTKVRALRDKLETGLLKAVPDARINGDPANRLPNTTNLSFKYVEGEAILLLLDQEGICASSGSACTSGSLEPSHVLRSMGVPFTYAHGSVRFSLSRYTTEAEIDKTLEILPRVIARLREISPFRNLPDEAGRGLPEKHS